MYAFRGLCRLLLIMAAVAALALTMGAPGASAQQGQPQCSNGIDDDGDGAIDGADAGCGDGSDPDESDSPYAGIKFITIPLPLVTLQGTVDARGTVDVAKLQVRAQRGSTVDIRCKGKGCAFKKSRRIMITSKLRLNNLERKLRAPQSVELRIARPGELGKYVRYQVRRNDTPLRTDDCLDQVTRKVRPCYVG